MLKSLINTLKEESNQHGPKHPGFNVLIADDDAAYHDIISQILSRWRVDVYGAQNGKEALEVLDNRSIDLVFMDVVMPEINGIDATAIFRKFESYKRRIPVFVIGMSGYSKPPEHLEKGMNVFVNKPFKIADIDQVVNAFLEYRLYHKRKKQQTTAPFAPLKGQ